MDNSTLNIVLINSVYASLFVQVATGLIDLYVYFLPAVGELAILKKMLELELFVQLVEGSFYTWFAATASHVKNITPNRYYDWAITTPTMLFTFCLYLDYLGEREKTAKEPLILLESSNTKELPQSTLSYDDISSPDKPRTPVLVPRTVPSSGVLAIPLKDITLPQYLLQKKSVLLPIFALNWIMLIFGYLGEIGELDNTLAVICGFLPFITFFVIIYDKFAKYSSMTGQIIYWVFFVVWSLYGVAALATYYWKNIAYNILDLLAKNFFGMLLAYTLYTHL